MKFRLPSKPKLTGYLALALVAAGGLAFYFSDRTPPELVSFELTSQSVRVSDPAPQFEFFGRLTDQRGITGAEMRCVDGGEIKLLVYIAMSGGDRNRVSFGEVSGSFGWAGRWGGTSYDLSFEGLGKLPPEIGPTNCRWFAKVSDIVGNQALIDTGVTLEIKS